MKILFVLLWIPFFVLAEEGYKMSPGQYIASGLLNDFNGKIIEVRIMPTYTLWEMEVSSNLDNQTVAGKVNRIVRKYRDITIYENWDAEGEQITLELRIWDDPFFIIYKKQKNTLTIKFNR